MKFKFLILLFGMLVFSNLAFVSAIDWDNSIRYENNNMTAVIENVWGIPVFGSDLGTAKLKSHKTIYDVNQIGIGLQVPIYYEFNFKNNYKNGLGKVVFYDEYTNQKIKKDYSFVYLSEIEKYYTVYDKCINEDENNTCFEYSLKNLSYIDSQWLPYDGIDIPDENITIGVQVDVLEGEYIDVVVTVAGQDIDKHASFNASLYNGLVAGYSFDDADVNGTYGQNDITGQGYNADTIGADLTSSRSVIGKNNQAYNFTAGNNDYIKVTNFPAYSGAFTVSFWAYRDSWAADNRMFFWRGADATSAGATWIEFVGSNQKFYSGQYGNDIQFSSSSTPSSSVWHNIVYRRHANNTADFFMDGVFNDSVIAHDSLSITSNQLYIGGAPGNRYSETIIDEMYLWNRSITVNEIIHLYDNDTGSFYSSSCSENLLNTSWTSWVDNSSCLINDTILQIRSLVQYDNNSCGETANETFYEYQEVACNYCSYSTVYTDWTSWENETSCLLNDTYLQNRSRINYDENYDSCYAVTSIASDLFNSGFNVTYWETQELTCNYCSYSVVNSSWSSWQNQTDCLSNDTFLENRSLIEYDENYDSCYAITGLDASDLWNSGINITYWDFNESVCDYCIPNLVNESWSSWVNTSVCLINDTVQQNRSLIEYDNNFCGEVSNTTYWEFQEDTCSYVPCVNAPTNTSWSSWIDNESCQIDNTTEQYRFLITYDANESYCGNFTNITYYEYQDDSCIYVEPVVSDQFSLSVDFDKRINQYLLIAIVIFAGLLFWFRQFVPSAFILLILSVIMFFSDINYLFSLIPFACALVIANMGR